MTASPLSSRRADSTDRRVGHQQRRGHRAGRQRRRGSLLAERRESLQTIADSYFSVETQRTTRELANHHALARARVEGRIRPGAKTYAYIYIYIYAYIYIYIYASLPPGQLRRGPQRRGRGERHALLCERQEIHSWILNKY